MYKIFDIHTDILYDLNKKKNQNRFDFHLNQLNNSVIKGGIWTMYSPDDFDLIDALKTSLNEIDFEKLNDFKVILGLEGLRNLNNLEELDIIYNMGFRHAMVTWNEENKYATGAKACPSRGLTPLGVDLYKKMESLDMIIDLAHLNEKSFFEALNVVSKNIIYSHGCCKDLCNHPRNITIEQMKALKSVDGLFGLTLANNFVNEDKEKQDLEHFLDHLEYAIKYLSIDNVCFGFDFMDYLSEFPNSNIKDVSCAQESSRIIDGLIKRGYTEVEINKICYDNFYNKYKDKVVEVSKWKK